jgi:RNA polymerase sigma-70 factor (ECF subfamily)
LIIDKIQLVEDFGSKISRLSHRMIFNNELAREAAQEVWYEIFKSADSFKGNSSMSTWIYTIAKRTILRLARSEMILREKEMNKHFELAEIEYTGNEYEKNSG